jgi:GntR family transcriptional regulator/MocR family aminotransferase
MVSTPPAAGRAPLLALHVDRGLRVPLHRQLYDQVRDVILSGRLSPGARLPSARALTGELGVSRNTVITAFDQLLSEGYIEGRTGSGTYVSNVLPDALLAARDPVAAAPARGGRAKLSRRGRRLAGALIERRRSYQAFAPGFPELDHFPFDVWGRLLAKWWRRPDRALLRDGAPAGYRPLRQAIADHLAAFRAVRCDADQVIVVSGTQQAITLVAQLLFDEGARAWVEEPGYPGLRAALTASGLTPAAVPVDAEGIDVAAGEALAPEVRLACVAPSQQYPLGVTMSLARRLRLLEWAPRAGAWILEDDYDSEYRYAGRPLAALQGLDRDGRVIYVGSFSKVMFPSLRIGYLVVPPDLAGAFARARSALDSYPSALAQPALAEFMAEGHFAAHVRRMRALYAARLDALQAAAGRNFGGLLSVPDSDAGMQVAAELTPELAARMSDREASARAAGAGVVATPLSAYFSGAPTRQGLLLGYAAVPEGEIDHAAATLARALAG